MISWNVQLIFDVQAHKNLECAAKMQKNVTVANLLPYLLLTQINLSRKKKKNSILQLLTSVSYHLVLNVYFRHMH